MLTVPRDLTYGELMFKITEGLGYGDVVFKYFDGDDTITVRSTEDLLEAYNFLDGQPAEDKRGGRSLRVTLEDAMENGIWVSPATSRTLSSVHTPCCSPSLDELIKAESDAAACADGSADEWADDSKLSEKLTDACSAAVDCESENESWSEPESDQELLEEIHAEQEASLASLTSFSSDSAISCEAQTELCEWFKKFRRVKMIGAGSFANVSACSFFWDHGSFFWDRKDESL